MIISLECIRYILTSCDIDVRRAFGIYKKHTHDFEDKFIGIQHKVGIRYGLSYVYLEFPNGRYYIERISSSSNLLHCPKVSYKCIYYDDIYRCFILKGGV